MLVIALILFAALGPLTAVASVGFSAIEQKWGGEMWGGLWSLLGVVCLVSAVCVAAGWCAWMVVPLTMDPIPRWLSIVGLGCFFVLEAVISLLVVVTQVWGHTLVQDERAIKRSRETERNRQSADE